MNLGTDQLVQEVADSSAAAAVCVVGLAAAAVECAACDGPGVAVSAGVGLDVMAEVGTEQGAGEAAASSAMGAETVPERPAIEKLVLVVAAAAADEPAPGATAWTAGADGLVGTAVNINVLGSKASSALALHRLPAAAVAAERTASLGV